MSLRTALLMACAALLGLACQTRAVQLDPPYDGGPGCMTPVTATPSGLDFGEIEAFARATQTITLNNCGNLDVEVTPVSIGGYASQPWGFSLDRPMGTPFIAPAHQSVDFNVTYWATLARADAMLTLALDVGTTLQIPLIGATGSDGVRFSSNLVSEGSLFFGFVPLGRAPMLTFSTSNMGKSTVYLGNWSLIQASSAYTFAEGSWTGGALAAGASESTSIVFTPTQYARYDGSLWSDAWDWPIQILGYGGGAEIRCSPATLDFGTVAVNSTTSHLVTCTNVGTDVPGSSEAGLIVSKVLSTENPAFDAEPLYPYGEGPVRAGESASIVVYYTALAAVTDVGELTVVSNATYLPTSPSPKIVLTGSGLQLAACKYTLLPASTDFGDVPVGTSVTASITLTNIGAADCIATLGWIPEPDCTAFTGPAAGSPSATQRLSPGDGGQFPNAITIPVTFTPPDAGHFGCDLSVFINAAQPVTVAVSGTGVN